MIRNPANIVTGRSGRGNSWSLGYCGLPESDEAEVRTLHQRLGTLGEKGFVRTEIDRTELERSTIGRTTAVALREVQERYGLPETGEYDAETRARLESVAAGIAARGVKRVDSYAIERRRADGKR